MIADNKRLLETEACSDFTIQCQDRVFKVHRFLFCGRSEALAKLCNGSFQKAAIGSADWGVQNPAVVEHFLRYLYTLHYDDAKVPDSRDPFFEEPPLAVDAGSETPQPENRSSAQLTRSEEGRYDYHANADDQQVARHHRLIINMGVYAMADMHRIPRLMQLAQSKSGTCAATWPHGAFPAIIQRMLGLTGPDDEGLRRLCAKICAEPAAVQGRLKVKDIVARVTRPSRIEIVALHGADRLERNSLCVWIVMSMTDGKNARRCSPTV